MQTVAKIRALPFLIGVGTAIATIILWQALTVRETNQVKHNIQLKLSGIRKLTQVEMESRIKALARMADRWKAKREIQKEEWEIDAQNYVNDLKGFQAIGWVDPAFHVRWVVPLKGNERTVNLNLAFEDRRRVALERARDMRIPTLTRVIDLIQGGKGFLSYIPIFRDEKFNGFILGVFRTQALFQAFLGETRREGFSVTIYDGDTEIYSNKLTDKKLEAEWAKEMQLEIRGVAWRVRAWPATKLLNEMQSSLPILVLFSGLTVALLLGIVVMNMQSARVRDEQVEAVNHELRTHVFKQSQAEITIRRNEAQLASVLETAADAILTIDSKGIILTMNRTAEGMFGWEADQVIGQNVSMLMPNPQRDEHDGYLSRYMETGEAQIIGSTRELRGLRSDGSEFPMELSVSEVDINGTCTFTGIVRDISERKLAEITLEKQIKSTESLADHLKMASDIAISFGGTLEPEELFQIVVDEIRKAIPCTRCVIASIDRETLKLDYWGISSDIEMRPLAKEQDPERIELFLREVYETKQPKKIPDLRDFPIWDIDRDPNRDLRSHLCVPIVQNDQAIGHISLVSTDVAAFTHDQVHLLTSVAGHLGSAIQNSKLHKEVAQRAEELARSNAELSQFTYVASHDLQEPLRMVTSYTELLAHRYREKLDADALEFIDFASDGARRMQSLINDLLQFSRVDRKGKELEPTDCEATLDQILENLKISIEESGAIVTSDPLPMIMADRTQLGQLFQNLIGNAIKFRNEDPPRVHVSVTCTSKEWVFSIQDNGIGIEPEYKDRIFHLFQRLHTREEFSGTGIGLAICKKIVERHGGKIWVESEPNKGCTFNFTIPAQGEVNSVKRQEYHPC